MGHRGKRAAPHRQQASKSWLRKMRQRLDQQSRSTRVLRATGWYYYLSDMKESPCCIEKTQLFDESSRRSIDPYQRLSDRAQSVSLHSRSVHHLRPELFQLYIVL